VAADIYRAEREISDDYLNTVSLWLRSAREVLREAEKQEVVITRHGKPAGVLIGFESQDDCFDYKLENDPRFLERVEKGSKEPPVNRWPPMDRH
jgi:hypothetical protein